MDTGYFIFGAVCMGLAVFLCWWFAVRKPSSKYDEIDIDNFKLIKVAVKASSEAGEQFLSKYCFVDGAAHFPIMIQADDNPEDVAMKWAAVIAPEHDLTGSIYKNPGGAWVVDEALGLYTEPRDRTFYYNNHFHRRDKRQYGYFVCIA